MSGATVTEPGERAVGKAVWIRTLAATIAATAFITACSCSSGDDDDPPTDTTTTASTEEQEVEAAYLAYRGMVTRLLSAPDPNDPEIDDLTVGENRDFLVAQLASLQASGTAVRFAPEHHYDVTSLSVSDEEAVLKDCTVDAAQTVNVATGEVISEGTSTELLRATLVRDESWKVQTIDSLQRWEGVTQCGD